MKKRNLFIAVLSLLALAGCEKPETEDPNGPDNPAPTPSDGKTELVFNARTVDLTKTSLNGAEVFWTEGDAISLFSEAEISENEKFISTGKDAATTQFTGKAKKGEKYYAIYPYAAPNKINGTTATCYIPKEQELKSGSFENGTFPAIAVTETDELVFNNIAGLVSFKVPSLLDRTVVKAVLSGNAGEKICGGLTVDFGKTPMEAQTAATAGTEITLTGEFTEGDVCYIAVAPVVLSQGLTLTFIDSKGGTMTVKQDGAAEVKAGTILTMDEFKFKPSNLYVTVNGGGSGVNWAKPTTLSEAIAMAEDGNTIHIAAGKYLPADETAKQAYTITKNIKLIGGYPESPANGAVADPAANKTIISANNNKMRVFVITAPKVEGMSVNISGITVTEADGTDIPALPSGETNIGKGKGAAFMIIGSRVSIENCIITRNKTYSAAGLYNADDAETRIENCTFSDNEAIGGNGACVWNTCALLDIRNTSFIKNSGTSGVGGAVYCFNDSALKGTVKTMTFINGCIFKDNEVSKNSQSTSKRGAGVYSREGSYTIIANSTFYQNIGNGNGCAISFYGAKGKESYGAVISCTVTGNHSKFYGALELWDAGITNDIRYVHTGIYNTIVSGNTDVKGNPDIHMTNSSAPVAKLPEFFKCCIDGTDVYGADGTLNEEANFDFQTMFATYANGVVGLTGTDNPAQTMGMSAAELKAIDLTQFPGFDKELLGKDQNGKARTGKVMGATVE